MTDKRRPIRLKVAAPCKESWDEMEGDGAIRHCGKCDKSVYHLSMMSTEQAERLLFESDKTPCVRFYQRGDGSVMLGDCPVGLKSRRRKQKVAGIGVGVMSAVGLAVVPFGFGVNDNVGGCTVKPSPTHVVPSVPAIEHVPAHEIMGEMIAEPVEFQGRPMPEPMPYEEIMGDLMVQPTEGK